MKKRIQRENWHILMTEMSRYNLTKMSCIRHKQLTTSRRISLLYMSSIFLIDIYKLPHSTNKHLSPFENICWRCEYVHSFAKLVLSAHYVRHWARCCGIHVYIITLPQGMRMGKWKNLADILSFSAEVWCVTFYGIVLKSCLFPHYIQEV